MGSSFQAEWKQTIESTNQTNKQANKQTNKVHRSTLDAIMIPNMFEHNRIDISTCHQCVSLPSASSNQCLLNFGCPLILPPPQCQCCAPRSQVDLHLKTMWHMHVNSSVVIYLRILWSPSISLTSQPCTCAPCAPRAPRVPCLGCPRSKTSCTTWCPKLWRQSSKASEGSSKIFEISLTRRSTVPLHGPYQKWERGWCPQHFSGNVGKSGKTFKGFQR